MTRIPALAALLTLPFLAAPAAGQGAATGAPAGTLRLQSTVAAVRIAPLQRLPRAPASAAGPGRTACGHQLEEARTPAGREVALAGWGVTGEVAIGPYQAVSFVGAFQRGTSGTCLLGDANIGIFRGTELLAVAYAPPNASRTIGRAVALERDGLRIWDGDYLNQPLADLRIGADGSVTVQPLAAQEAVCDGAASIPNIYGRPINEARSLLQRSGWAPAVSPGRAERERLDGRVADLVRRGVPEVEDCSGTGMGFCGYTYRGAAGTLSVTTVGEGDFPTVAGYSARCGAPG
ncbi:hypothetical protein [Plastoroseomonas hellenica]|uniref:hypothetical protein n=1 Tax=Plastoroseomonas hellenica TaxID=2687306 RepID=UPI001BA716E8|nr:hypothetical protein [Plastoroseomonas hellenica]